jgi:hypothetical protein
MALFRFLERPLPLPSVALFPAGGPLPSPAADFSEAPARRTWPATPARNPRILFWAELGIGMVLTLVALYLHAVFATHAGGLWRDEVNTVRLATLPSLAKTWSYLQFDSFPILIFPVVRGWAALFSTDDASLRALGMLIGIAIFGALWLNARLLGYRFPLVALALLGCNPLFIRYADSLRAYGLGILLMLLTFGAVWRVIEALKPGRVALAMILAMLSVQALYYNSVLLLSICVAGAVTAARERDWKKSVAILAIGAPAALSLLPYAGTIHSLGQWNFLVHYDITPAWIWKKLSDVTGSPDPLGVWIWSLLFLGALVLAGWQWQRRESLPDREAPDRTCARVTLFASGTLVLGTVCYAVFLQALQYYTQPWYYVTYLALAAMSLDAIFGAALAAHPPDAGRWRVARLVFVWGFAGLMAIQARSSLLIRQTNLDLVARALTDLATRGDLIVDNRWECAIPFDYYYHGVAADTTLPQIADHRFHRYDLVLQQMLKRDAVRPVLDQAAQTLRAGHRVWLLGAPVPLPDGVSLEMLDPGRNRGALKGDVGYYEFWAMQLSQVLLQHATSAEIVNVPMPGPVAQYENLAVSVFAGWQ